MAIYCLIRGNTILKEELLHQSQKNYSVNIYMVLEFLSSKFIWSIKIALQLF